MTGTRTPLAAALFGCALLSACAGDAGDVMLTEAELVVCADGPTLKGIDVSKWQGQINWDAVKNDGVHYAFIRSNNGTNILDEFFAYNWAEAKRVGIKRGAYQYFRANQDPIAQADKFLATVGAMDADDLPPVIDVEDHEGSTPAQLAANVGAWIQRVEAATGKRPIIYTGLYFWKDHVGSDAYVDYPLWIAQYGRQCPDIPAPWTTWAFWQITSTGRVAGVSGDVDVNTFHGDLGALEALARGMTECGDGFCNGDETPGTCEADCPICKPVSATEERIIDNGDICQELGGNPIYWREDATAGYGGKTRWTYTVAAAEAANYCAFNLSFNAPGTYRVDVHVPQPFGQAQQATYEIGHGGETSQQLLNQSTVDGWTTLGEYRFAMGADQYVFVGDNTGEARELERRLACDALRVVPLDVEVDASMPPPDGGVDDGRPTGVTASGCAVVAVVPGGSGPRTLGWLSVLGWLGVLGARLGTRRARRR